MRKLIIFSMLAALAVAWLAYGQSRGCCSAFCFQVSEDACPGEWSAQECAPGYCSLGCCHDERNISHNAYSKGECLRKGGTFAEGTCPGIVLC